MLNIGRFLVVLGIGFLAAGLIFILLSKADPNFFSRLPGDILIRKKNFTFYFPLTTSIILSVILSLIFFLFSKK